jgi:hypothetical protein
VALQAIGYPTHRSRSHNAVIGLYDEAGNVIETHEARGRFQRMVGHVAGGNMSNIDEISLIVFSIGVNAMLLLQSGQSLFQTFYKRA